MKKIIETVHIKLNYSENLEVLAQATIPLLEQKLEEYKLLFGISDIEQIIVNYFDTIEEFRKFIYSLRGEKDSLPAYARGTYDQGMINSCVRPESQLKRLYTASHELFHILYSKYILNNDYSKRIVWYDEGMAQYMSGENATLNDDNNFNNYYLEVKEQTKVIPNINDLMHGETFVNDNYNGYDLSYLSVRYLSETLTPDEFKELMPNFKKIKELGNDIVQKMFNYYDSKLEKIKSK